MHVPAILNPEKLTRTRQLRPEASSFSPERRCHATPCSRQRACSLLSSSETARKMGMCRAPRIGIRAECLMLQMLCVHVATAATRNTPIRSTAP